MSDKVSGAETGVIILNHAINDNKEYFDPKIKDTLHNKQKYKISAYLPPPVH